MPETCRILLAALGTAVTCLSAGRILFLKIGFHPSEKNTLAASFVTGAAMVSWVVFFLSACRIARWETFLGLGLVLVGAAVLMRPPGKLAGGPKEPATQPFSRMETVIYSLIFLSFTFLYLMWSLAPEISPDGSAYHLGLVARYLRQGGFVPVPPSIYAYLSQGGEMLFFFAFAFGRHSSAAVVHFGFLLALVWLMVSYGFRRGFPRVGICGALLVYLSPVIGIDAASAYVDVAVACVLFALFYLLEEWSRSGEESVLVPIGLLSGFAYALKYTAFLALPFALTWIILHERGNRRRMLRSLLVVGSLASLMILPWMVKNAATVGNPVAPFFNRWFPNPYVSIDFEDYYRSLLTRYGLPTRWQIPIDLTVRGQHLHGLLGPVFLFLPLALLALRRREGRQLMLAGVVFALPYAGNIGTRFLIPALPFLALALALALGNSGRLAAALVVLHAALSWPSVTKYYAGPDAWRIDRIPIRAALRLESEPDYMRWRFGPYGVARMLEEIVPPHAKVLSISGVAEAYTSREVLIGYQGTRNRDMQEILWSPLAERFQPTGRIRFRFPQTRLEAVRVVQIGTGVSDWAVNELRILVGSRALDRLPAWRLRGWPNPWDVQFAFDNAAVTSWRARQPRCPGMFLEVDFGRTETIDALLIECSGDIENLPLRVEGRDEAGKWRDLNGEQSRWRAAPAANLRWQAASEIKALGVDYLLIHAGDPFADDIRQSPGRWGLRLAGERYDARLYRIE